MANRRNTNRRQSRRKRQRAMTDAVKLLLAFLLIIVAAAVVIFVRGELGGIDPFGRKESSEAQESTEESDNGESESLEPKPGFNTDAEGRLYYLDETGERLSEAWLSLKGSLYYIDTEGYVQTEDLSYEGMDFEFDEEGAVSSISYDPYYSPAGDDEDGYFSSVRDRRLVVYLDEDEMSGSFFLIRYRRTTDDTDYDLGGDNKQYTSPYSMQIDGNYIYYLPWTDREQEGDGYLNRNLYRIEPGATVRELVAEDVDGYRAVDGDIYYQKNGRIFMTRHAGEDTTVPDFSAVEDFYVDIKAGDKAYLYTADGRPVTLASDEFKAGNFRYELGTDGEILSVKEKSSVSTGGYTYTIEEDSAFGAAVSRVVRTEEATGKKEIISSEFDGSCGNLHYDFDTGYMYAEYTDKAGNSRILKISKDGDVDYLLDDGGAAKLKLYALQDNNAVCRAEAGDGSISFVELRLRASVPMALSVEPEELTEGEGPVEIESSEAETKAPVTEPTTELQNIEAPTTSLKDTPVAPQGPGAGLTSPGEGSSNIQSLGPGLGSVVSEGPPG